MYISYLFNLSNCILLLLCFAGGFAMVGVIVYGTIDGFDSSKFHFSFGLCIIAALGAFAAGALIIIGRSK